MNPSTTAGRLSPLYVSTADLRVLCVLWGLARKFKKNYVFPSQVTLQRLVASFTGRGMCRRTMNYHLGALERDGYIERQRRHRKLANGELDLHSTMYFLKRRTFAWLGTLGFGDNSRRSVKKRSTGSPKPLRDIAVQKPAQKISSRWLISKDRASSGDPPPK